MESIAHNMTTLFQQLGLDSEPKEIESFIKLHSPLNKTTRLENASFWSVSQAQLLHQLIHEDADWSIVVEQLNNQMH
ncbi:DUF2789 domain-containing protein [Shewanella sp. OPT22]|nr:DUF2789 domain-containing protein [Shewanella sp. OPT22]